jgi:2-methylfumaryl-CoA hydratase
LAVRTVPDDGCRDKKRKGDETAWQTCAGSLGSAGTMSKSTEGNRFEDFAIGRTIRHAAPRTLTAGDAALYTALTGNRFAVNQSAIFARDIGYAQIPLDDLLVFHMVFGMTVADISLNAVANLGYAGCRFLMPVAAGDTLRAESEVIGLKEHSNGQTGTVYVRSRGFNQHDAPVLDYVRWVMVRKGGGERGAAAVVPSLAETVAPADLGDSCPPIDRKRWDFAASGSGYRFDDYRIDEKIDHVDGVTVEEAEHMTAARLYHNMARVHYNALEEKSGRFGRRIVYGGHVMSLARALSFNGLQNCFHISAINGGRHAAPLFAGQTVYAWSFIKDKARLSGRNDVGALRIVTRAMRDQRGEDFPVEAAEEGKPGVVLELDYWALIPI